MSLTYEKLYSVLEKVGISFSSIEELKTMKGYIISRELLRYKENYDEIANLFPRLKHSVDENKKNPLLYLLQKILYLYKLSFKPVRKLNGTDEKGLKKYQRFFLIERIP